MVANYRVFFQIYDLDFGERNFAEFKMADPRWRAEFCKYQQICSKFRKRGFLWSLIAEFGSDLRSRCWRTKFGRIQNGGSKMADGIL